jgi:glycosyltransferase involved in cell wall biosynthesis
VVVVQWWTGTVLHSYLVLAAVARVLGAQVILEFHEVQDPGESNHKWAALYVRLVVPFLIRAASAYVVHSEFDRALLGEAYKVPRDQMRVIPLAAYELAGELPAHRDSTGTSDSPVHVLYFGLIRPYKGVEDLLDAFAQIPPEEISRYRLTVVGETWEGWDLPARKIASHIFRDRIHFVNRYVTDAEVSDFFRQADIVTLPYRRSSQSATLHLAMAWGLPVVATRVGGLAEAAGAYPGGILVEPSNPAELLAGIVRAERANGRRFIPTVTWNNTAESYGELFAQLPNLAAGRARRVST